MKKSVRSILVQSTIGDMKRTEVQLSRFGVKRGYAKGGLRKKYTDFTSRLVPLTVTSVAVSVLILL